MSESTGSQGVPNPTHDAATSDATKPAADAPPASAPGTATAAANTPAAATNTTSTTNAAKPAAPAPSTAGAAKPAGKLTATGTVKGAGGLYKAQYSRGVDVLDKGIEKLGAKGMAKSALKIGARAVPGIGTVVGLGFAAQDLKDGDVVGALLNTIGAIPGPIGWIGLGAGQAWEAFGPDWHLWGNGGAGYGLWDAPDGTSTHMLPAAASEAAGVREVDAALATVQRNIFGFEDGPNGSVWNSNPLGGTDPGYPAGRSRGENVADRYRGLVPSNGSDHGPVRGALLRAVPPEAGPALFGDRGTARQSP